MKIKSLNLSSSVFLALFDVRNKYFLIDNIVVKI